MAALAFALIGSAIGNYFGYAAIGYAVGSMVGNALFPPEQPDFHVEGPRLSDLKVQNSAYGQMIPIVYGTMRIAGNVIWSTNIVEHVHTESHDSGGGKGGGGGGTTTTTTYTYTVSFATMLCEGVINDVTRIWADDLLIFNRTTGYVHPAISSYLRIYNGTEDQPIDTVIQANKGVGNTPAYRGRAYLVFGNFLLTDFGNRIPNITAEVQQSILPPKLSDVVADLLNRAGVDSSDYDVTDLATTEIRGYTLTRQSRIKDCLEPLATAYNFIGVESGGKIKMLRKGRNSVLTISGQEVIMEDQ